MKKNKLNAEDRFYKNLPEPFLKSKYPKSPVEIYYHSYGASERAI